MEQQQVENTIKFYESLVMAYPTPESWALNILEACKRLTSGIAQTNFYSYLFDPNNYSFRKDIKLISKAEEEKYNEMVAKFDATNPLKVKMYKNGWDAKIVYLPNKDDAEKTKSLASLPPAIQSEKQIDVNETGYEKCGKIVQIQEEKIDVLNKHDV